MIISNLVSSSAPPAPERARPAEGGSFPRVFGSWTKTKSRKRVDEDAAKGVATAYRCAATIVDDIAQMPLQVFNSFQGTVRRIYPDATTRNTAYLLERQPNRWMDPFTWKRTIMNWLLWWGNAYIWNPPSSYPELFILDASKTYPVFDQAGNKWYQTTFASGLKDAIPDVEMTHLMINSKDGLHGMSVLEYARETMGRQLAAHETQDSIAGDGLKPTAALWVKGKQLSADARSLIRKSYLDAVETGAVIFESEAFDKFETITMKPTDAQFLEGIMATDADIANFFKFPLYKLNMGKQSYESNEQQDLDYLKTCLNPHLVHWEQSGGLKWIAERDQPFQYLRFNRDSVLRTDAKTRTEILVKRVAGGMLTPNEARQIEDMNGFSGGDSHYLNASYGRIGADGRIEGGRVEPQSAQSSQREERE